MKKFLSVLLALAVAFTFTFGSTMSAFAATKTYDTTAKYLEEVATLETEALDYEAAGRTATLPDGTGIKKSAGRRGFDTSAPGVLDNCRLCHSMI